MKTKLTSTYQLPPPRAKLTPEAKRERHLDTVKAYRRRLTADGGAILTVALDPEQMAALDSMRQSGEPRATALRRLAFSP